MTKPARHTSNGSQPPPAGLLPLSRALWIDLHEVNHFAAHEDYQLEPSLRWFDETARLRDEAEALTGRDRAQRSRAAMDASTTGLRHWRTLKFTDPAKPPRRPGRPPGRGWPEPI